MAAASPNMPEELDGVPLESYEANGEFIANLLENRSQDEMIDFMQMLCGERADVRTAFRGLGTVADDGIEW